MASEARKLQVGLFVISSTVILIAGFVWLGASRFFETNVSMVSYFSESVQGIEAGSPVKYRGVAAGRVEEIRIAPDRKLIEVVLSIDERYVELLREDPAMRAQLQLAGITGLRYVEIDRHKGDALQGSPSLTFEPPFPQIPSTPSSIKEIQSALDDIYERVMSVDLAGISKDVRDTLQAANSILRDERVTKTLDNIEQISASTNKVASNLERITTGVDIRPAVDNLSSASAEARTLMSEVRTKTKPQLDDAIAQITLLAQTVQQLATGMQYTLERVDRTVGNLEHLTEEVREQPSRLLFSDPPKPRRPGDHREEER